MCVCISALYQLSYAGSLYELAWLISNTYTWRRDQRAMIYSREEPRFYAKKNREMYDLSLWKGIHLNTSAFNRMRFSPLKKIAMAPSQWRSIHDLNSVNIFDEITLFFTFHLSWPSPCAGPAIVFVIQYFRSCAMSSVSWYFFMSLCMLSLHLFFGRPLLLLPETYSFSDFAHMWVCSRIMQWPNPFIGVFRESLNRCYVRLLPDVFISNVVQPGLPSCPSQHPHFWCDPTWSSLLSISTSSFLMWSNLVFPLVHLNILISDVVQPGLPCCPSQHPHFCCDPTWSSLLSISTSSFLMWSNLVFPLVHLNILISDVANLVFPLLHLNILISDVIQPGLPSCPSQHPHFWCGPTWSSLLSISTSSFLMWSNLVFPLLHLNILISDVVQPGLPSCPSQHPHFWCGPTWSSLLSISTSSFLMWSNLVFPLVHLNILISDVVQPGLHSSPSQLPHFWCGPTWSSLLSISTSSFLMWSNLVFPLVHLNILISDVIQPGLRSCPSQHPHFWCGPTWSSLLSISTSSFLMWSNLVFPLVHLNILISDVVQPGLPSCPSQHPHFWCSPTWSSLFSISPSSFLMWSNLVFPLVHLNILISDVVQPGLPSSPSQLPHFWCGPTWSFLLSISTSSFLMWSNLVFPLLHLTILISDVVQPGLPSSPSQHPHFWCDPTWSSLLSISTSSFLMWSNLVFPLLHLNILISDVIQPGLPSCPSQHPHFWCGPTWSSLLSISTSSFLMWSNLVFPLVHLNILISDVIQPGLPSCPSQHPHFWCGPTWSSLLSISTSSFLMWSNLIFPLVHLNILISDVIQPGLPSCPSQHPHF